MRKIYFSTALIFLVVLTSFSNNIKKQQPNIFFFFADDWGKYASVYDYISSNTTFKTPMLDKFAKEGVIFNNAHVNAPSCTPCRSSLLSGQYFYRTRMGAILQGAKWDLSIPSYPLLLEDAGYFIGYSYKVWAPGTPEDAPYGGIKNAYETSGRRFNHFSQNVTEMVKKGKPLEEAKEEIYKECLDNFNSFLNDRKQGKPYCFWFGPTNTHRKWTKGSGKALWGLNPDSLKSKMPKFIPDVPEVREDMCDYFGEVLALENMFKRFMEKLDSLGEKENTIVVVSGDHGIPGFPRGKCNVYPLGTDVSLFIQWPGKVKGNREIDDFVNLMDLAPTFLEAAGVDIPKCMTGKSILPLLLSKKSGQIDMSRDYVVTGRERHVMKAREGFLPYPQRSIQTKYFLYVRNFKPEREPMGSHNLLSDKSTEPSYKELEENTFAAYSDFDSSPTKAWMIKHRKEKQWEMQWRLGFEKRPAEELYDLHKDQDYLNNVADDPKYAKIKEKLSKRLMKILRQTKDPRVMGDGTTFDKPPYVVYIGS